MPALAGKKLPLFAPTRKGMQVLMRHVNQASPDTIVVATPHNLRLRGHIGVVTAEHSSGRLVEGKREVSLKARCDVGLAKKLAEAGESKGLPVVAANYGTFEGPTSDMPMDWGTLIPLWFLLKGAKLKSRVVIVTPSREISTRQNFEFGRVVAEASKTEKKRVAFVASADQAHAHRKTGPYGYDRRAAEYDDLVVDAVKNDRLGETLLSMDPRFVGGAKPDSVWQMAMLAGALSVTPMRGEVVSYQVATYFGMMCASYRPM